MPLLCASFVFPQEDHTEGWVCLACPQSSRVPRGSSVTLSSLVVPWCFTSHLILIGSFKTFCPCSPGSRLSPTNKRGVHCTFIGFRRRPIVSPGFESTAGGPRRYLRRRDKALPFKKEHISIWLQSGNRGCGW